MDITQFEFEIRRHAFIQAIKRDITPDMVYATLRGGSIKRFGKNRVMISKKYKSFTVVCVDEIMGTRIKIVTVEKKR